MKSMIKIDRESLELFREESAARMGRIGESLDRLAKNRSATDMETLHSLFRETHSLKSAANLLRLRPVEQLAHKLEDILESIRSGSEEPDETLIDILRAGYRRIEHLVKNRHVLPLVDASKDIADIERQLGARHCAKR
jgi:chemotaxis protein histidine kinase CheA